MSWLVKQPSDQELSRARLLPLGHINRLEEVGWGWGWGQEQDAREG